jgi:hypothetical protein
MLFSDYCTNHIFKCFAKLCMFFFFTNNNHRKYELSCKKSTLYNIFFKCFAIFLYFLFVFLLAIITECRNLAASHLLLSPHLSLSVVTLTLLLTLCLCLFCPWLVFEGHGRGIFVRYGSAREVTVEWGEWFEAVVDGGRRKTAVVEAAIGWYCPQVHFLTVQSITATPVE